MKRARKVFAILLGAAILTVPLVETASAKQLQSSFSWRMEDRFGSQTLAFYEPDGRLLAQVPIVTPSREYVHSSSRTVQFDACPANRSPSAAFVWRIDNGARIVAGCRYEHTFSTLGLHRVELTITGAGLSTSSAQTIELRDSLIVSLGDSYASGEGNPDVPGDYAIVFPPCRQDGKFQLSTPCLQGVRRRAAWSDSACHRSFWAGPAQAALALERADPHSTVTFVSLACSGATIEEGLLGRQLNRPPTRPPQLEALAALLCSGPAPCMDPSQQRRVDALIISIGGNDLGFSDIVRACLRSFSPCTGDNIREDSPVAEARRMLSRIGLLYIRVFRAVNATLNVADVLLTENADPSIGEHGQYCGFGGFPFGARIQSDDVRWLHQNILRRLNDTGRSISRTLGWIYVDGIADPFHGHGYCARDHWFVTYPESWAGQGDDRGTMHPNRLGHQLYAQRISGVVAGVLRR